jgi:hypothetical protein
MRSERNEGLQLSNQPVEASLNMPTIKPPTVVINKEAKEKLVVRHSLKGNISFKSL